MKKQNKPVFAGKQLAKETMKNLKGGLGWGWEYYWNGIWTCVTDGYSCQYTRDECIAVCDSPSSCQYVFACP